MEIGSKVTDGYFTYILLGNDGEWATVRLHGHVLRVLTRFISPA